MVLAPAKVREPSWLRRVCTCPPSSTAPRLAGWALSRAASAFARSLAKYARLADLLPLVRWRLLPEDRRQEVEDLAAKLIRPQGGSGVVPPSGSLAHEAGEAWEAGEAGEAGRERMSDVSETFDAQRLVGELFAPPSKAMSRRHGERMPQERQLKWGHLVRRTPPNPQTNSPAGSAEDTAVTETYLLHCTQSYMIGRSRKSDIRIGHDAPMPYISSQHFKLYHAIHWSGPQLSATSASDRTPPRLDAWLEDLSQNGTFVNGKRVGRGKQVALVDGDKVELVFTQGQIQVSHFASPFPSVLFACEARAYRSAVPAN